MVLLIVFNLSSRRQLVRGVCILGLTFWICSYWLHNASKPLQRPNQIMYLIPSSFNSQQTAATPSLSSPAGEGTKPTVQSSGIRDFNWHYRQLQDATNRELYRFDWDRLMPLMRLEAGEAKREFRVRAGLAWMRTQGLVVASTVRNAMRGLPDSLKNADRLRALFNKSWLVIVETDSEDKTRDYLHNLSTRDPTVRLLGCGQLNSRQPCRPNATYSSGQRHQPGWHVKRTKAEEIDRGRLMSALRNQYLTYTYDYLVPEGATLMLLMDADMTWFSWDLDNIAQGLYYFMAKPKLQQLCSHTCYANRLHLQDPCTLTFFTNKHFGEDRTKPELTYDNSIRKAPPDLPPVKVSSCFQSLAFYRLSDMARRRLLYGAAPEEWICEHNTLSRRLSEVYFDSQMQINIDLALIG